LQAEGGALTWQRQGKLQKHAGLSVADTKKKIRNNKAFRVIATTHIKRWLRKVWTSHSTEEISVLFI
jgi:hypothetical protein